MKTVAILLSLFALSRAASLVPVDTSVVNVKSEHSGQDYSYSIHENRGFAVDTGAVHHTVPIVKTAPGVHVGLTTHEVQSHEVHPSVHTHGVEQLHPLGDQHHETKATAKAISTIQEYALPIANLPTPYSLLPLANYQYAYTYPYAYAYNLIPLRTI